MSGGIQRKTISLDADTAAMKNTDILYQPPLSAYLPKQLLATTGTTCVCTSRHSRWIIPPASCFVVSRLTYSYYYYYYVGRLLSRNTQPVAIVFESRSLLAEHPSSERNTGLISCKSKASILSLSVISRFWLGEGLHYIYSMLWSNRMPRVIRWRPAHPHRGRCVFGWNSYLFTATHFDAVSNMTALGGRSSFTWGVPAQRLYNLGCIAACWEQGRSLHVRYEALVDSGFCRQCW